MLQADGTPAEEEGEAGADDPPQVSTARLAGWYFLLCCLIASANGAASAALNFVNMPVKVVFILMKTELQHML